jgi:hypothetical protein
MSVGDVFIFVGAALMIGAGLWRGVQLWRQSRSRR